VFREARKHTIFAPVVAHKCKHDLAVLLRDCSSIVGTRIRRYALTVPNGSRIVLARHFANARILPNHTRVEVAAEVACTGTLTNRSRVGV